MSRGLFWVAAWEKRPQLLAAVYQAPAGASIEGEGALTAAQWVPGRVPRLDGRLLVRHQGKILTPQEAPALATQLRTGVAAGPVVVALPDPDPMDWRPKERLSVSPPRGGYTR